MSRLIPDAQRQWREFFGAKLTAVVEVDDQFRYAWIEQALDPETGGLMDADPARQGTTTSGYALELNNAEVSVGTQPIVMMRVRAGWNDDVVYEFDAGGPATLITGIFRVTDELSNYYFPAILTTYATATGWAEDPGPETIILAARDKNHTYTGIGTEYSFVLPEQRYLGIKQDEKTDVPIYATESLGSQAFTLDFRNTTDPDPGINAFTEFINITADGPMTNPPGRCLSLSAGPSSNIVLVSAHAASQTQSGTVTYDVATQYLGTGVKTFSIYPSGSVHVELSALTSACRARIYSTFYIQAMCTPGANSQILAGSGLSSSALSLECDNATGYLVIKEGGALFPPFGYKLQAGLYSVQDGATVKDGITTTFSYRDSGASGYLFLPPLVTVTVVNGLIVGITSSGGI